LCKIVTVKILVSSEYGHLHRACKSTVRTYLRAQHCLKHGSPELWKWGVIAPEVRVFKPW
jgi:hypothetical protein